MGTHKQNSKKLLIFLCLQVTYLFSAPALAQSFNFNGADLDFGLTPTSPKPANQKKSHLLPDCEDVARHQSVPGVSEHGGHCLGPIPKNKKQMSESEYYMFLMEEHFDHDSIVRVIKRNTLLMSMSAFLKVCIPRGGVLSPDGVYCSYRIEY